MNYDIINTPDTISLAFIFYFNIIFIKTIILVVSSASYFYIKTTLINPIIFSIKFISLISLLVFVRGGIPRYRYDFLTKLGWIKFLSLVLAVFLSSILLVYLF